MAKNTESVTTAIAVAQLNSVVNAKTNVGSAASDKPNRAFVPNPIKSCYCKQCEKGAWPPKEWGQSTGNSKNSKHLKK